MLYQTNRRPLVVRLLAAAFGLVAGLARSRADIAYLDGLPRSGLEDLGLRRGDDGSYRMFK